MWDACLCPANLCCLISGISKLELESDLTADVARTSLTKPNRMLVLVLKLPGEEGAKPLQVVWLWKTSEGTHKPLLLISSALIGLPQRLFSCPKNVAQNKHKGFGDYYHHASQEKGSQPLLALEICAPLACLSWCRQA